MLDAFKYMKKITFESVFILVNNMLHGTQVNVRYSSVMLIIVYFRMWCFLTTDFFKTEFRIITWCNSIIIGIIIKRTCIILATGSQYFWFDIFHLKVYYTDVFFFKSVGYAKAINCNQFFFNRVKSCTPDLVLFHSWFGFSWSIVGYFHFF